MDVCSMYIKCICIYNIYIHWLVCLQAVDIVFIIYLLRFFMSAWGEQGERERKVRRYLYVYYLAPFHKDFSARGHPGTSCSSECSVGWNAWDEIHCRENDSKPLLLRLVISHHVFTVFTRFKRCGYVLFQRLRYCLSIWCIAKTRPLKILAFE